MENLFAVTSLANHLDPWNVQDISIFVDLNASQTLYLAMASVSMMDSSVRSKERTSLFSIKELSQASWPIHSLL